MPSVPRGPGLQAQGEGQGLPRRRARRPRLGLHGRARRAAALARLRGARPAAGRDQRQHDPCATATGCRRSKARSTPRISASCMAATSIPRPCRRTSRSTSPSPTARRSTMSPTRRGARSTPATAAPGPARTYWRFANFLFPCWSQAPNGEFDSHMHARGLGAARRRPHHVRFIWWKTARSAHSLPQPAFKDGTPIGGTGRGDISCCPTPPTGWAAGAWRQTRPTTGAWTATASAATQIYSGIDGIHLQDQAITESMGPIIDYGCEHLAPSDQMITRTRRRLLLAARALRDKAEPAARRRRSGRLSRRAQRLLPRPADRGSWQEVYARTLAASVHPP